MAFCECGCGREVNPGRRLIRGHLSEETLKKIKKQRKRLGPRNSNWHGGISKLPYSFDFNGELKKLVMRRDNYTCQLCGSQIRKIGNKSNLHIHHIDYNKFNSDPKNLITLCLICHSKTNYNRKKWKEVFEFLRKEKVRNSDSDDSDVLVLG